MPGENMTNITRDIRKIKTDMRARYRERRSAMSKDMKKEKDNLIFSKLTGSLQYIQAEIILTYVSTEIEIDTLKIIEHSISCGKIVAVPRCIDGTRNMEFYIIKSLDDLSLGTFSVLEPDPDKCKILKEYGKSVCLVPGLVFDFEGYRLGYGKGYYDRFLSRYTGTTVGLCYSMCITKKVPRGKFDSHCDYLISEKFISEIS